MDKHDTTQDLTEDLEAEERLIKLYEKQGPLEDKFLEALKSGDIEERRRCAAQIEWSPSGLMALKQSLGADFIRREKLCTRRADAAFGQGWLDEPNRVFGG